MISFSRKEAWISQFILLFLLQFMAMTTYASSQPPIVAAKSYSLITESSKPSDPIFALPQKAKEALQNNLPSKKILQSSSSSKEWLYSVLYYLFLIMALTGIVPVIAFFIEHNLSGLHAFSNHYQKCKDFCPKIAVVVPAWNEALVLEHTIDILLKMDYPLSAIKIYIIDDGSTDNTQELLDLKKLEYPENVYHVRKEGGGKGKAHAVNYGLKAVLSEDWAQAFLLIDADISFKKDALRRLARHIADPEVGAVTAYIKVGNRQTNYITRSIGFEYIVSQSIARRAQNVLGVVACLAGGAQLHTRENIEALGGEINTSTLAEDTYTTFSTQKLGKKVIFEGNAYVYAEEPKTAIDVWKQRFRWARGNIQITKAFKDVWFRKSIKSRLGNLMFGTIWFCVLLTPLIMILSALGLVGLFILDKEHSSHIFFYIASVSLFVYLYTTLFSILVDRRTSSLSWLEGILYPGLVSLTILAISVNPDFFFKQLSDLVGSSNPKRLNEMVLLFMETWSALCMFWAWVVFRLEYAGVSTRITNFLFTIVGYGPLLCTINLAAYIAEIKRPNLKWDKTEKISSKRRLYPHIVDAKPFDFDKTLAQDLRREYHFLLYQLLSLIIVCGLFIIFYFL
ncbi:MULTISPECIES: glycosyltransferase family 2 protein [Legionella]|uniref:Glycosyltransferase, family 2 n=1 Tax=Legionella drozanskii LLAP-1 TaxID=1212489 RepID=A0A0W0TBG2_9GAMM|nr:MULTISPECIES: glycosyltransferase [Legionella]KTC92936.1 glycosyltransferase, family 2 [Legionella drozanskii LLAP-1]PJE13122.1 MAG: glycosyltransferase family 2 protein [Legionella sp.]